MASAKTVEEYWDALSEDQRDGLERIREAIKVAAPDAEETLSYGIPAFKLGGKVLVYYAAFRDHYSIYPYTDAMVEAVGDQLKPYLRDKGTIWFDPKKRIPVGLIKQIVKARIAENETTPRRRRT